MGDAVCSPCRQVGTEAQSRETDFYPVLVLGGTVLSLSLLGWPGDSQRESGRFARIGSKKNYSILS